MSWVPGLLFIALIHFPSTPFLINFIWFSKNWLKGTCRTLHLLLAFSHYINVINFKYDLNPVFRQKGGLLWPPLHPSPHFHPPCLGRRTTVHERLSTPSFGPHLVGHSKSTFLCSPTLYLPCCMSQPATGCPHHQMHRPHQHHRHGAAENVEWCGQNLWAAAHHSILCIDTSVLLCFRQ